MRLDCGQGSSVCIEARQKWNATAIDFDKGQKYCFSASGQWRDAKIRCGPDGYESTNWILKRAERCRRVPAANWFSLIGAFDSKLSTAFVIGKATTIVAVTSGMLTCFANDVAFMYWNNCGSVQLEIKRIA
jgi:hypothetical protein